MSCRNGCRNRGLVFEPGCLCEEGSILGWLDAAEPFHVPESSVGVVVVYEASQFECFVCCSRQPDLLEWDQGVVVSSIVDSCNFAD